MNNSLIFIPDISGFTKFVNETELTHSQHIIQELIEVILDANQMNLSLSEIEGDAVLFYKINNIPSNSDLSDQVKQMFMQFHKHLLIIERDRVCHCGACKTAINLTLKFLVHAGEIVESTIKDHIKLMGKDVIVAHRLLKNNIESDEYLLLTDNYLNSQKDNSIESKFNWSKIEDGNMQYKHIGQVNFKFIELSSLKKNITVPQNKLNIPKIKKPIKIKQHINSPKEYIYSIIIDLDLRSEWTNGLLNIEYNKNEIPKIGTTHKCEFDQGSFDIEIVYANKNKTQLQIAEKTRNNLLFPKSTSIFTITDNQAGTDLTLELHYVRIPILTQFIEAIFRKKIETSFSQSISNLKEYCETNYDIRMQKL